MSKLRELSQYEKLLFSESLKSKMMNLAIALTRGNIEESEDLIQQSYLKALEKKHLFKGDNIDKWVIKILKNLFIDSTRKGTFVVEKTIRDFDNKKVIEKQRVKRIETYGEDVPEAIVTDESDDSILQRDKEMCLERLNDKEREVIALKQTDSYKEIAKILDINTGNVRQIIFRAKEKFMICMGFHDE